jgi:hypothetical protein
LAFKSILPDIKKKYKDLILAVCYPEVFEDEGVDLISIAEASMLDNPDKYNIYKFMTDHNWRRHIIEAYREMYGTPESSDKPVFTGTA